MRSIFIGLLVVVHAVAFARGDDTDARKATEPRTLRLSADPLGPFRPGLEKRVKLDFVDAPLKDVVAHLAEQAEVTIRLDENGLEGEGIPLDEPVTLRSRGVPVETALAHVLEPLNLAWAIENEEIVVTSVVDVEDLRRMVIATYDVRSLLDHPPEQERLQSIFNARREYPVPQSKWLGFGGGDTLHGLEGTGGTGGTFIESGAGPGGGLRGGLAGLQQFPPASIWAWRDDDPYGDDWLLRIIEGTVGYPEHWSSQGGPADIWDLDGLYRIRQFLWAHDEIDALLSSLDGLARKPSQDVVRPVETEGERRIRLLLDKRITVRFEETPIDDFARALGEKLDIDVKLDEIGFEEEGIPLDEPISVVAEKTSVRAILGRVLPPLNLEWHVKHEQLRITSTIVAEELGNLTFAFADVRDLTPSYGGIKPLIDAIVFQTGPPDSWAGQGGPGDVSSTLGGVLVVRQTEHVVREIEQFLASLRNNVDDRPPKPMPKPEDVRMLDYAFNQHDPAEVRELVEVAVDGDWDGDHWTRVVGRQLFVKTTLANHLEIDRLLRELKPAKRDAAKPAGSGVQPDTEDR